jgi:hypothetical protein
MNVGAAFNFIYQHIVQPKPPQASKDKPVYEGTSEQAKEVEQQDTMVRKYHRPLGHGLSNRQL